MLTGHWENPTRRIITSTATNIAAAGVAALMLSAGTAVGEDARLKEVSLQLQTLPESLFIVTSSDGESWDTITSGRVTLRADAVVDTRYPGYVERAAIYLGDCARRPRGLHCSDHPRLSFAQVYTRDWRASGDLSFGLSDIEGSTQMQSYITRILSSCNRYRPTESGTATVELEATLSANTRKAAPVHLNWLNKTKEGAPSTTFDGGDASRAQSFRVGVECVAFSMINAPPEPVEIDLRVRQIGTVCPMRTEVTAILKYNVETQARFRFKHNGEYSRIFKPKTVDSLQKPAHTPSPGPRGRYVVEKTKVYHLDPGRHHFRIETETGKKSRVVTIRVACPPFKVTSVWLDYKVASQVPCPKRVKETSKYKATRPGSAPFQIKTAGGLIVASGIANFVRDGLEYVAKVKRHNLMMDAFESDMMALITNQPDANSGWVRLRVPCIEALSGTLDLRAFAPRACKGEAALSIRTNIAGKIPYQLDCTGGRSWSGRLTSHQTGPDTFVGVATLPFSVTNNEHVNCALKTRKPLPVKILALKGRVYACIKRAIEPASGNLTINRPHKPAAPQHITPPTPPKCKTVWTEECKRVPKRNCRPVSRRKCKIVPKRKCTTNTVQSCRPVKKRMCKRVRGRRVCRTQVTRKCNRRQKRACVTVRERQCRVETGRKCTTVATNTCRRKSRRVCAK